MAADLKLLVAGFLRGRHLRRFIERQPGGLLDLMQADVGQGGLGVPSYKFFQVLLAVTSHTGLYVGATGNMEGGPVASAVAAADRMPPTRTIAATFSKS
jgi:hypothetical protein